MSLPAGSNGLDAGPFLCFERRSAMRRVFAILLALVTLWALTGAGRARANEYAFVTGEYAPYTSAAMENYGHVTQLVLAAAKRMDVWPILRFAPWPRCYHDVKRGAALATFPYAKTPKREQEVLFSDPVVAADYVFFYRVDRGETPVFEDLEDLRGLGVSAMRGFFYQDLFKEAGLKVALSDHTADALKKVHMGMLDLYPEDRAVGWRLIRKHYPEKAHLYAATRPFANQPLHLVFSKAYPKAQALCDAFNRALGELRATDEAARILAPLQAEQKAAHNAVGRQAPAPAGTRKAVSDPSRP